MLLKIFKYDLKNVLTRMLVPIVFFIVSALLLLISTSFDNLRSFITGILTFIFVVSLLLVFIASVETSVRNYYRTIFKDQGYLTNTLPVRKSSLILSKYIAYAILLLISSICFYIALQTLTNVYPLIFDGTRRLIFSTDNIKIILAIFSQYFLLIPAIFLAIALGHLQNKDRILTSGLFCFIFYITYQALMVILVISTIGISSLNTTSTTNINSVDALPEVMTFVNIFIFLNAIIVVILFFINKYILEKKLNLE